jgi:DNA-directed RNA polymerase specialized sigma24 family protein
MSTLALFPSAKTITSNPCDWVYRLTDDILVERIAAGDLVAASQLKARHGKRLHAIAIEILGDETEAQRVVDATFEEACAGWPPERGHVKRWLTRLVRREARAWREVLSGIAA